MTVIDETYTETIEAWRAQAEENLRADDGWLTVAGLFWLHEGENRFGSDATNDIVLPADSAPSDAGSFRLHDGHVTVEAAPNVALSVNGGAIPARPLQTSTDKSTDYIELGALTLFVHRSGERLAIRVRDRNNPARATFAGRRWFPVNEAYRVTATFVPYDPPRPLTITNIVGDTTILQSPGALEFTLDGQAHRLDVSSSSANGLWLHLHDQTAGKDTYPGGRFLTTPLPENGLVTVDFNRAVSPPCAFTPFATCPMVQPQNRLPLRIDAGERWQTTDK